MDLILEGAIVAVPFTGAELTTWFTTVHTAHDQFEQLAEDKTWDTYKKLLENGAEAAFLRLDLVEVFTYYVEEHYTTYLDAIVEMTKSTVDELEKRYAAYLEACEYLEGYDQYWDGTDETWPEFRAMVEENSAQYRELITAIMTDAEGGNTVEVMAAYGVTTAEPEEQAEDEDEEAEPVYDEQSWLAYLTSRHEPWHGEDDTWEAFRQEFVDGAPEALRQPATDLITLTLTDGADDKAAYLAEYGLVAVGLTDEQVGELLARLFSDDEEVSDEELQAAGVEFDEGEEETLTLEQLTS